MPRKKGSHMNHTERLIMDTMIADGKSKADVARRIGVNRSTITREFKRGAYTHLLSNYTEEERYSCDLAQNRHDYNMTALGKMPKVGNDYAYMRRIEELIMDGYSPQAALKVIEENEEKYSVTLSYPTVYRYIREGMFANLSIENLPQAKKQKKHHIKRQKRASAGPSIDERPEEIESRETFGHWEMDTVKGKLGETKSCLLVLSERQTREELVFKLPDQKAASVVSVLDELEHYLGDHFSDVFRTITVDNGVEFADYEGMCESVFGGRRTDLYYCHAYCSWERGTNENINRMIRRKVPKGSDIDQYSDEYIKDAENWINNYPRRMFGYRTSASLFAEEMKKLHLEAYIS